MEAFNRVDGPTVGTGLFEEEDFFRECVKGGHSNLIIVAGNEKSDEIAISFKFSQTLQEANVSNGGKLSFTPKIHIEDIADVTIGLKDAKELRGLLDKVINELQGE